MTVAAESAGIASSKVPVWQTVKTGYRDTFGNPAVFAAAAALPFLLTVGLVIGLAEAGAGPMTFLIEAPVSVVLTVCFELVWLRFLLLGPKGRRPAFLPEANRRFRVFLGYTLLLALLTVAGSALIALPAYRTESSLEDTPYLIYALGLAIYVVGIYFYLRLGFVLLFVAVDAPQRLGESWRLTRGNGMWLLLIILLSLLPLLTIPFIAGIAIVLAFPESSAQVESGSLTGWALWLDVFFTQLMLFCFYGVSSAALVQAFCHLSGWSRQRDELYQRFE